MNRKAWFKRRWQEFRMGHAGYFAFLLSFINTVLITYRLLIEHVSFLGVIFISLSVYATFALIFYVPLATIVGHLHRKKQLRTEMAMREEQSPYLNEIMERLKRIEELLKHEECFQVD